jgi:hypothetical protein
MGLDGAASQTSSNEWKTEKSWVGQCRQLAAILEGKPE